MDREQILAMGHLPSETVRIDEWDCSVVVKTMDARQLYACYRAQAAAAEGKELPPLRFSILKMIHAVFDENGNQMFKVEDAASLEEKAGHIIDRLVDITNRLNGSRAKAAEEAKKNSVTPDSASG